jgi:hypothetical protein
MGTPAPTLEQIANIRVDLGTIAQAFTDPEIITLWGRVQAARDEVTQHDATLALMVRQALASFADKVDYSTGNTSEKLSQQYDHLMKLWAMYKGALERVQGHAKSVVLGNLRVVRPAPQMPDDGSETNNA